MTRALPTRFVDSSIARLGARYEERRRTRLDRCTVCDSLVGRQSLAVTLPVGSNASTPRFSVGRYYSCSVCVADYELVVRVPARDGSTEVVSHLRGAARRQSQRGPAIVLTSARDADQRAAERDSADEDAVWTRLGGSRLAGQHESASGSDPTFKPGRP